MMFKRKNPNLRPHKLESSIGEFIVWMSYGDGRLSDVNADISFGGETGTTGVYQGDCTCARKSQRFESKIRRPLNTPDLMWIYPILSQFGLRDHGCRFFAPFVYWALVVMGFALSTTIVLQECHENVIGKFVSVKIKVVEVEDWRDTWTKSTFRFKLRMSMRAVSDRRWSKSWRLNVKATGLNPLTASHLPQLASGCWPRLPFWNRCSLSSH